MCENLLFVTDSRKVVPGSVFVALKGTRTDGHLYVQEALNKGALYVVVQEDVDLPKDKVLKVGDTVEFLLSKAKEKLQRYKPFVIGITGSNGKTTTKEVIYTLIGEGRAFRNQGNLNTEIGLPISILNEYKGENFVVFEMAMNKVGDIARLCEVAKPKLSILLNVGSAHRGVAGSDEAIIEGKLQIIQFMDENGTAVVHHDQRLLQRISNRSLITFGNRQGDYQLLDYNYEELTTKAEYKTPKGVLSFNFQSIWNVGQLTNLAAAIATIDLLDMTLNRELLETFPSVAGRFRVFKHKERYTIDDCYNASLESFKVAIETLKRLGKRSFAVVGSIKEQGQYSVETHKQLGKVLEELDGVIVYNIDHEIDPMECSKELFRSDDPIKIRDFLRKILEPEDAVLFKASRSVEMERVLKVFLEDDL
ncbi:UDP-N-acetylmuramoyl-tripeptide--D-alanyl-D-alanine ligase [Pseudothermotoga sp. U03pept]|uniref:UDP-N-acetylmuramoyl-tripeptide--D-alanyl-D- alanine ligase n=1 Tax=Pseudothermotoga sp. U03pept TaxID=3447012 RepID=UPI003F0E30DD